MNVSKKMRLKREKYSEHKVKEEQENRLQQMFLFNQIFYKVLSLDWFQM